MKIIIDRRKFEGEELIQEVGKITVLLSDDVEYRVSVNQFGELVINKSQMGAGESSIILLPSVSNEIRLK